MFGKTGHKLDRQMKNVLRILKNKQKLKVIAQRICTGYLIQRLSAIFSYCSGLPEGTIKNLAAECIRVIRWHNKRNLRYFGINSMSSISPDRNPWCNFSDSSSAWCAASE